MQITIGKHKSTAARTVTLVYRSKHFLE
jgi:hypothetical protein